MNNILYLCVNFRMEKYSNHTTISGHKILTNEYIQHLRSLNRPDKHIILQEGGQETAATSTADIIFYGGERGGGKSFIEIFEAIKDIRNSHFVSYIFRKEKDDFASLIEIANNLFPPFGEYKKSQQTMQWDFTAGGYLKFVYYKDSSYEEFKERFQGREIPYIGIDEGTQMPYKYFKYLMTCNRNSKNMRNRILVTCNPDPESWVAEFIDWWIGEDGLPLEERDGKVRYCFMDGDTVDGIYWGNTREEVYEDCRHIIDRYWKPEYYEFSTPEKMFIKSVTFIRGRLHENKILLKSDPSYVANLVNQDDEQRARDLDGNWKFKEVGTDLISNTDMEAFFDNTPQDSGLGCVTCDPALQGGDNAVFWYWKGWHIADMMVAKVDSKTLVEKARSFLALHQVPEERFAYDVNGLGQLFRGWFPNAVAFNNGEVPSNGDRTIYENLKSEYAYKLVQKFKARELSIDPLLLVRRFEVGKERRKSVEDAPSKKKEKSLREILKMEKKAMRKSDKNTDKNWALIKKEEMIKMLRWSPDFIESMLTRMALEKEKAEKPKAVQVKGLWRL